MMHDTTGSLAAAGGPTQRFPFSFTGKGGEYFGIWIVNLLLTIVTLGIYSAWAKVRKHRYLCGNTWLADHNFEYHATPKQLLKGRLIAIGALILYLIVQHYSPIAGIGLYIVFLIALPWIIVSSLRFNARMTSYRNVRFDFVGTTGGAAKVFLLYPILCVFTFFLLLPFTSKRTYEFYYDNLCYGGQPFKTKLYLRRFYLIYGQSLLMMIGIGAAFFIFTKGLAPSNTIRFFNLPAMAIVMYAVIVCIALYMKTMLTNYVISNLSLNWAHRFESVMSPAKMTWIVVTNIVAIVLSLGMLYPWAVTRTLNYRLSNAAMAGSGDFSTFSSEDYAGQKAVGEELADVFDIGIGF